MTEAAWPIFARKARFASKKHRVLGIAFKMLAFSAAIGKNVRVEVEDGSAELPCPIINLVTGKNLLVK